MSKSRIDPERREQLERTFSEELGVPVTCIDAGFDSFVFQYQEDANAKVLKVYNELQSAEGPENTRLLVEEYMRLTNEAARVASQIEDGGCLVGEDDQRFRTRTIILPQGEIGQTQQGLIYTKGQEFVPWPSLWQVKYDYPGMDGYEGLLRSCQRTFEHQLSIIRPALQGVLPARLDIHPVNIKVSADLGEKMLFLKVTDLYTRIRDEIPV